MACRREIFIETIFWEKIITVKDGYYLLLLSRIGVSDRLFEKDVMTRIDSYIFDQDTVTWVYNYVGGQWLRVVELNSLLQN